MTPKVYVFNFETQEYELCTEEESKDWVDLIDMLNSDCAEQKTQEVLQTNN